MRTLTNILGVLILLLTVTVFCAGNVAAQDNAAAQKEELFAIAAEGPDESAQITNLTGRAPFYQVYDMKGNRIEVVENIFLSQEFNIGPQAAALLGEKHVTVLIGGKAGPKMMDVLVANNIRFVYRKGVVQDVVKELKAE